MASEPLPFFPNYMQLRARSPLGTSTRLWAAARVISVVTLVAYAGVLWIAPQTGLFIFWRLTVPVLPLVFLLAPGLWRNVCPLAAANQTPRLLRWTRGWTAPAWWKEYSYVLGFLLFFGLASARKLLFNASGPATALLLLGALGAAFVGGLLLKGKSGWCSSLCPLYPIQRLYNQTPFALVANQHCDPCVGCTKNCYDFNPRVAYLADLYDDDRYYVGYRKFFAAVMPGFIVAFFITPNPPEISVLEMYAQFGLAMVVSVGLFFVADAFLKVSIHKLTALWGAVAINLFYWFGLPSWLAAVGSLWGWAPPAWLPALGQAALAAVTAVWLYRTYAKEPVFLGELARQDDTRLPEGAAQLLRQATRGDRPEITFLPNDARILADAGRTLLEIAEANNLPIEAGCRMGMCGADPVLILDGQTHLSPMGAEEKSTLDRLGLGDGARLACMCRVRGPVTVSLQPRSGAAPALAAPTAEGAVAADPSIQRVVIIGNGVAGVTAADHVRRRHPNCEIHLVGRERHHLYNRMAITRLIYGRSAMNGLYLQPDSWYEERRITCWLNTHALSFDGEQRAVHLATGEVLPYDRLILASGSACHVPPVAGFGLPGTFVLREAEEAMEIRAFAQRHGCRRAVVGGGGLLGLEAAYALHKLGLHVTVLERGPWLLRRQLDQRGGEFLGQYLSALGLEVLTEAEAAAARGEGRLTALTLKDGRTLACDIFLAAVGIQPNVELARGAGLAVKRGVVVDDQMRTTAPDVFAAGDICEFAGEVPGLWPVAVEQARVAAINALGGAESYRPIVPVTTLKVAGVDLTSIGQFEARGPGESVISLEEPNEHRYRKLVIADGRIVGAILLGYPQAAPGVTAAVKADRDVSSQLEALRAGDWASLTEVAA